MSQRGQAFFASSAKYRPPGPPPMTVTFMNPPVSLVRDDGSRLDLEARFVFHERAHLHHRHGRIVAAHQFPVGGADLLERRQVLLLVQHVPGEAHQVFGFSPGLSQHVEDVLQRLPELPGERALAPFALAGPADLAGDEDELALRGDAVGEALRPRPARRLQRLDHRCALSLKRCSLPVSVRGSESTNSTARGYLYGAITFFTWSCSVFFISSPPSLPGLRTTKALTIVPRSSSGQPITPHSATGPCCSSADSTSGPAML